MGALKFYNLNVVTEMASSKVTQLNEWERQLNDVLEGLRAHIAQFEGYNDEKYVKSIDPTIFEQMEGFGAMDASAVGPGGYIDPDLPPPPGWNAQQQEGAEGLDEIPQQGGQQQTQEEGGRFNPVGRAQGAADAMTGGSLQATEAMNQLP
jgi:hypothetical protein